MKSISQLVRQAYALADKHKSGCIKMTYQGETIGTYDLPYDGSFDTKSPESWVRQNICFEVKLRGRSISKVELVYHK